MLAGARPAAKGGVVEPWPVNFGVASPWAAKLQRRVALPATPPGIRAGWASYASPPNVEGRFAFALRATADKAIRAR